MSASTSAPSFATNVLNSASGATFDIASGKAVIKVSISNDRITQLPVKKAKGVTYYSAKGETFTALSFHALDAAKARKEVPTTKELNALMKYKKDPADKKDKLDTFPTIQYTCNIYTTYKISTGITADKIDSSYGRGTTTGDVASKDTSVMFHESQHGGFALNFLNTNSVSLLDLKQGMLKADVEKATLQFFNDFNTYNAKFNFHMQYDVDCVGTVPDFCSALETEKTTKGY